LLAEYTEFGNRLARQSKDPFNVVLDVCGGLLAAVCRSAIEAARLDPYKGVLHGTSRDSPALALDLEDVYRPQMVLAICVGLFTKKVIDQDDFVEDGKGHRLTKAGISKVCRQVGRKLQRSVTRGDGKVAKTYLQQIHDDAAAIAAWIEADGADELRFFEVR
jgi:CRISPR-associated protein Cas1